MRGRGTGPWLVRQESIVCVELSLCAFGDESPWSWLPLTPLCLMLWPLWLLICPTTPWNAVSGGGPMSRQWIGERGRASSGAKPENRASLSVTLRPLSPPNSVEGRTSGFLWRFLASPCECLTSWGMSLVPL